MGRHILLHQTQNNYTMKLLFVLALVGAAQCSPFLKNLPANADVSYEYDGNRLEGIKIDYNDDKIVYAAPAAPVVTSYSAPAAPAAAPASVPTYYEVDDDGDFDVATHVVYRAPAAAPVLYRLPAAPAPVVYRAPAPAPVVYSAPTYYYTFESAEDDK